jgi:hypothetical protein
LAVGVSGNSFSASVGRLWRFGATRTTTLHPKRCADKLTLMNISHAVVIVGLALMLIGVFVLYLL